MKSDSMEKCPVGQNDPSAAASRKNQAPALHKEPASGELAAAPCSGFSGASVAVGLKSKYPAPAWFYNRFHADLELRNESYPILKYIGMEAGEHKLKYRFDLERLDGTTTIKVTKEYLKALHYIIGHTLNGDVFVDPAPQSAD